MNDWQLLPDYVNHGSETAFRTLVDRHLGLVYGTAQRQVSDTQLAEDVAQTVFILLARKAPRFGPNVVLPGWLFHTTRFVGATALRSERRRQRREQEAFQMAQLNVTEGGSPPLGPWLDEAINQLSATDRDAVLLRFGQGQSLQEVGTRLGVSEEAAKKRVNRAVEKLRGIAAQRGVTLSVAALGGALAEQLGLGAPVGLATTVAAKALVAGVLSGAALPPLTAQTLNLWRLAKLKWAGLVGTATVATVLLVNGLMPDRASGPEGGVARGQAGTATRKAVLADPVPAVGQATDQGATSERVLRFHAVAKDTGEPVRQATLAVNTVTRAAWKERYDLATDEQGWAKVPYPPETGRLDVGVLSSGWAARFATWIPGKDDPIPGEYTLALERVTNAIGGWLRDAKEQPVANAEITIQFMRTGDSANRETPRERVGVMGEPMVAHSDRNGWWSCAVISPNNPGEFQLEARHPDFGPTTIFTPSGHATPTKEAEQKALELLWTGKMITRLNPGLTLSGVVLNEAGRPIAEALVAHEPFATEAVVLKSGADGSFTIQGLGPGNYDFSISKDGYAPEYRQANVQPGMSPTEVRLRPGALLRLRLMDEYGLEVAGARVLLEQWGEVRHKLKWEAESGADGRILWNSAPREGELQLCAIKDGWCYTRDIKLRADSQEHVITMRRALVVTGRVTEAGTGRPIEQMKAFPGYGEGQYSWERLATRRSTNGLYTVRFEEDRMPWRVRVEADGFAPFQSEPLLANFSGALDVVLQPVDSGTALRGIVCRPDGSPAAGAEVALLTLEHDVTLDRDRFSRDPGDKRIVTADKDGQFAFEPDPVAHSVAAASRDGFARLRVRDSRQPVTLRLQPWGRIEGVIDPSARSRQVDSVALDDAASPNYRGRVSLLAWQAKPDANSRFVFDCVPPESFCLYICSGVGIPIHHQTPVAVASGTTTKVTIAEVGSHVKGRLVAEDGAMVDWSKQTGSMTINSETHAPGVPTPVVRDTAVLFSAVDYWTSEAGRREANNSYSRKLELKADGSFQTDEPLPPGAYRLRAYLTNYRLDQELAIPDSGGNAVGEVDLGAIAVSERGQNANSQSAPAPSR